MADRLTDDQMALLREMVATGYDYLPSFPGAIAAALAEIEALRAAEAEWKRLRDAAKAVLGIADFPEVGPPWTEMAAMMAGLRSRVKELEAVAAGGNP